MTQPTAISLFSGIEGFGLGLERAGFRVVAQVEIDPACQRLLARHFPGVPRWGDITEVQPDELPAADLVCGGFPCQDISVAGRRAGLGGARSGLWWQFHRILAALHPRWVVIENVPGLLSSNNGRDMGAIVGSLGDLGYMGASRVLDAQHFGLAQRRRRVFIVGCLGDWTAPCQVLLEPESGEGHPAAGRAARQGVAASLTAGVAAARGVNAPGRRAEDDVNLVTHTLTSRTAVEEDGTGRGVPIIAGTLTQEGQRRAGSDNSTGTLVGTLQAGSPSSYRVEADEAAAGQLVVGALTGAVHGGADDNDAQAGHLLAFSSSGAGWYREGLGTLTEGGFRDSRDGLVTHALTAAGADASEDGTGRGTPIIAVRTAQTGANGHGLAEDVAHTLDAAGPQAVSFNQRRAEGRLRPAHGSLNAQPSGKQYDGVMDGTAVRRLTPTECERLQGFPDGWTAGQPDSTRYRQLGNAVAVPVAEWIGHRILDAHLRREAAVPTGP